MNIPPDSIPECNLQELVEMHIQCVHMSIKEGNKDFMPTLLVESVDPLKSEPERQLDVIGIQTLNETRFKIFEELGAKYYKEERLPIGIAFAAEAWSSKQMHCRPSQSDDRQEIIFIAAKGIGGNSLLQHMPVTRDKDGRIIERAFIARSEGESQTYLLDRFFRGFFDQCKAEKNLRS